MKKIVSFAASLLLVAGSLASCGKNNDDEPIEIPFTKYSLVGTNCDWNTIEMDKVIIINSYEELEKYITCTDGLYPDVDFSENTLLLVGRTIPGLVKSFTASF